MKDLDYFPYNPALTLIMEALIAGNNATRYFAYKRKLSHGAKYSISEADDFNGFRTIEMTSAKADITVELANTAALSGSNIAAKKMFVYLLIQINERALSGGELRKDYICFPLQELVEIGLYSSMYTARRGAIAGMDILLNLKIHGRIQVSPKRELEQLEGEAIFWELKIAKGLCTVTLNPRLNWGFLTQYFTVIPQEYFQLPNRSSDLLFYICFLARQKSRDITERGYFTLSFRSIWTRLQLPSEDGTDHPKRDIKDPITEAVRQIGEALPDGTGLSLLPVYDGAGGTAAFLERGYLKVSITGDLAEALNRKKPEPEQSTKKTGNDYK